MKLKILAHDEAGQAQSSQEAGQAQPSQEAGQAVVEFIFSLVTLLGIVMVFVQLGLNFGVGSYFQYATYMAARTYLASGKDQNDQLTRADGVLMAMISKNGKDRWPGVARAGAGQSGSKMAGRQLAAVLTSQGTSSSLGGVLIGSDPTNYSPTERGQSWMEGVQLSFHAKIFLPAANLQNSQNEISLTSEAWLGREDSYEDCMKEMTRQGKGGANEIDNGC